MHKCQKLEKGHDIFEDSSRFNHEQRSKCERIRLHSGRQKFGAKNFGFFINRNFGNFYFIRKTLKTQQILWSPLICCLWIPSCKNFTWHLPRSHGITCKIFGMTCDLGMCHVELLYNPYTNRQNHFTLNFIFYTELFSFTFFIKISNILWS